MSGNMNVDLGAASGIGFAVGAGIGTIGGPPGIFLGGMLGALIAGLLFIIGEGVYSFYVRYNAAREYREGTTSNRISNDVSSNQSYMQPQLVESIQMHEVTVSRGRNFSLHRSRLRRHATHQQPTRRDNDQVAARLHRLQEQNDQLTRDNQQHREANAQLRTENAELRTEIAELRTEMVGLREQVATLSANFSDLVNLLRQQHQPSGQRPPPEMTAPAGEHPGFRQVPVSNNRALMMPAPAGAMRPPSPLSLAATPSQIARNHH